MFIAWSSFLYRELHLLFFCSASSKLRTFFSSLAKSDFSHKSPFCFIGVAYLIEQRNIADSVRVAQLTRVWSRSGTENGIFTKKNWRKISNFVKIRYFFFVENRSIIMLDGISFSVPDFKNVQFLPNMFIIQRKRRYALFSLRKVDYFVCRSICESRFEKSGKVSLF